MACGSDGDGEGGGPFGGGGFGAGLNGGGSSAAGGSIGVVTPPTGPLDGTPGIFGSYALGEPVTGTTAIANAPSEDGCGSIITGIVRDFKDTHPDFESFTGNGEKGIVRAELGDDLKPVYASATVTTFTTGKDNFDQWYRHVPGVNEPYLVHVELVENEDDNVHTFHSDDFFPLDGAGFGDQDRAHNFHFTTEFHTEFVYSGGETFRFTGDDDLWVFINDRLAIDLGGLHPEQSASVDLDEHAATLGISRGGTYRLSLFHAERHTEHSNFRIDTSLHFVNCGSVPVVR